MDGMTLPDYHGGDQVNPGSSIAEVIEIFRIWRWQRRWGPTASNLRPVNSVEVKIRCCPAKRFGQVQNRWRATSHEFWDDNARHKFDVAVEPGHTARGLRPASRSSKHLGDKSFARISIPGGAVFGARRQKVYCKPTAVRNAGSQGPRGQRGPRDPHGLPPGTGVALVNPEKKTGGNSKTVEARLPAWVRFHVKPAHKP